ncbi:hypothetical protein [Algoriphagus sediminis]|uniref:Lipoprotein n=1 Tax=Algoriphagus sediminis TaxID=3057113 RepID=A0ABT7Y8L4_9BACT|nr:hypothetical protein [Algoriphagus sediminis]MDN3202865.1 hypothetical protein [Algoriphagus sediminis]
MRSHNSFFFLLICIVLFGILSGCAEDEDRNLRTDLPTEANQIFLISRLQYEHLFTALTPYQQFLNPEGLVLPGCPDVKVEEDLKRITLTYREVEGCENSDRRTGVIILDLALQNSSVPRWFMEFKDYTFEGDTIQGIKTFGQIGPGEVIETFEMLRIIAENQSSFVLNGALTHSYNSFNLETDLISSIGEINGKNPVGRQITSRNSQPLISAKSCFLAEDNLPVSGEELWEIQRGNSNSVLHTLKYETSGICETTAKMVLPDGRNLILNP